MNGQRIGWLLALCASASIGFGDALAADSRSSTSAGTAGAAASAAPASPAAAASMAGGASQAAAGAEGAGGSGRGGSPATAATAATAVPAKPLPSDIEPLASRALTLAVRAAGPQLVAVGDYGNILLSTDGTSWRQSRAPARAALTSVFFVDPQNGWAVGHDATIEHTADAGRTWTLQSFRPELQEPLLDVLFTDAQKGFAVGAYGLFEKTTDGGASWSEVTAPDIRADQLHLNAIVKLADGVLLIAGEQGLVAASSDQGASWQRLKLSYDGSLFGALPCGAHGALLFGLRGHVFVSDDVHTGTWKPVDMGTSNSFFGGTRLADGSYVLVGAEGTVMGLSADGTSPRKLPSPGGVALSGAVSWNGSLIVIGEAGIQRAAAQ